MTAAKQADIERTVRIGSQRVIIRLTTRLDLRYRLIKQIVGDEDDVTLAAFFRARGAGSDKEKRVRKILGGRTDGSGYAFKSRIRDISKTFSSPSKARLALDQLRQVPGIRVRVWASTSTPMMMLRIGGFPTVRRRPRPKRRRQRGTHP